MKDILKMIMGSIVFIALIFVLRTTNHFDSICFISTGILSIIVVIINDELGE